MSRLASLRDSIAIVSQEVTLFDDSIRANIALGRLGAMEQDVVAAAKAAAAHDFIVAQPRGYDTIIGDGGLRLSGGQRQRLALPARSSRMRQSCCWTRRPARSTASRSGWSQEALARFTQNRTALIIAHRLSTIQRADIICVMEAGEVVELGTHAELIARDGAYARLCHSQILHDRNNPKSAPVEVAR